MKLFFKQVDDTHVSIMAEQDGEQREVGHIFTPSGTGEVWQNAIQVCGFSEAFDYWGCGLFAGAPDQNTEILNTLQGGSNGHIQRKDIQMLFDWNTFREMTPQKCFRCFNLRCNCDNPTGENVSPFNVLREKHLLHRLVKVEKKQEVK